MPVILSGPAAADLRRLASAGHPEERCGILVGAPDGDDIAVVEVSEGRNLVTDRRRDRYELDPGAIVAAERAARPRGLDVVGFWHTHPDHPARPSGFDTERAWPEYVYLICSVSATGVEAIRAFRLEPEQGFHELPLVEGAAATG